MEPSTEEAGPFSLPYTEVLEELHQQQAAGVEGKPFSSVCPS